MLKGLLPVAARQAAPVQQCEAACPFGRLVARVAAEHSLQLANCTFVQLLCILYDTELLSRLEFTCMLFTPVVILV